MLSKRTERKIAAANLRRELVLRFPKCFKDFKNPKVPLKIKIHEDILAACPDIDPKTLGDALRSYVAIGNYPSCLIEGAARIDLNGDAAGAVTAVEAASAAAKRF